MPTLIFGYCMLWWFQKCIGLLISKNFERKYIVNLTTTRRRCVGLFTGFWSAADRGRLYAFLRRCKRLRYCDNNLLLSLTCFMMLTINWVSTPWGQILHEQGSVIVAGADHSPPDLPRQFAHCKADRVQRWLQVRKKQCCRDEAQEHNSI